MDKRTGTIITAVTALLCGCPGVCLLIYGGMMASGNNTAQVSGDPLVVRDNQVVFYIFDKFKIHDAHKMIFPFVIRIFSSLL